MNRRQYAAIAVVLVAVGGLILANLGAGDAETTLAVPADTAVESTIDSTTSTVAPPETTDQTSEAAPPVLGVAGDLVDLDGWLQTDATAFSDFDNTVRVVQFWTFSCINCKNTLDNLRGLYTEYEPLGLEVIGVHAPEFAFEEDPAAVAQAALDQQVLWPIALDTRKTNFRTWQTERRFWPRTYVIDRAGNIRFDRIGEGAYEELNATVAFLIENPGA